jgi:uncharacterized protein YegL
MAKEKKKKVTTTVTTTVTEEIISVPTNDKTHIICVLDCSGSMTNIMADSIGGFNEFLKKQKELPDKATITVVLFDDKYNLLYDNVDIKLAKELTSSVWYPGGMTALYDAIGKTINKEKANFAKLGDEKPSKVLVCVVTDGEENSSKEYNLEDIKKLIGECEKEDWNFLYLAANQDAFSVGGSFGISHNNTYNYTANSKGVQLMSMTLNNASASYRSMSSSDMDFGVKSKKLIDNDDNKPEDNSGTITTSNTTDYTVKN